MITNSEYIIRWVEKSKDETDYFDKFVYGFFALNALYSEYYDGDERRAIKELFRETFRTSANEFAKIMDIPEFDYFCKRKPIANCRYNPDNPRSGRPSTEGDRRDLLEKDAKISNRAMLMILYQIRCNLFHGNKAYTNDSDQEVMENASELLYRYNCIFIKKLIIE